MHVLKTPAFALISAQEKVFPLKVSEQSGEGKAFVTPPPPRANYDVTKVISILPPFSKNRSGCFFLLHSSELHYR